MLRSVQNLGVRNRIKLWRFFQREKQPFMTDRWGSIRSASQAIGS